MKKIMKIPLLQIFWINNNILINLNLKTLNMQLMLTNFYKIKELVQFNNRDIICIKAYIFI